RQPISEWFLRGHRARRRLDSVQPRLDRLPVVERTRRRCSDTKTTDRTSIGACAVWPSRFEARSASKGVTDAVPKTLACAAGSKPDCGCRYSLAGFSVGEDSFGGVSAGFTLSVTSRNCSPRRIPTRTVASCSRRSTKLTAWRQEP